jgi:hypothetical protein
MDKKLLKNKKIIMEKHKITKEIEALNFNKEKVQKWFEYGLNPRYGLSQELTVLMYELYAMSSGDNQYLGRYNCGSCQDVIYRKLGDFLNYGDNLGLPLLNWEPTIERSTDEVIDISSDEKEARKTKKKKKGDDESGTDTTTILE